MINRPWILRTDNLSVRYLKNLKLAQSSKLLRWSVIIGDVIGNAEIQHVKGIHNTVTDCISRADFKDPPPITEFEDNLINAQVDFSVITETQTESDYVLDKSSDSEFLDTCKTDVSNEFLENFEVSLNDENCMSDELNAYSIQSDLYQEYKLFEKSNRYYINTETVCEISELNFETENAIFNLTKTNL